MYRVIKYVNANISKHLTAGETAERFGYSKWYFCEIFKRYTGQTFVEYVRTLRMQYAALDILSGKKMVDVALSYGYDTQSGFNKAFVAQYGCYPTDYRKNAAAAHARYLERRSRMFMLSDRCSMLRDEAVEKKSIAKKICMQRAFYFVQGAAAADNVSPQEAFAAGLARVITASRPVIQEGELLVGYNYADGPLEWFDPRQDAPEKDEIIKSNGFSREQIKWYIENADDAYRKCRYEVDYYKRSQREEMLLNDRAALGRCISFNHSVIGYEQVLTLGFEGLLNKTLEYAALNGDSPFYRSIAAVCRAACTIGERYAVEAERLAAEQTDGQWARELMDIARDCRRVPRLPAQTFRQALQSLLFAHIINTWEDGINANSLGRLDQILYPYYQRDIENGIITRQQAFELICCLWIKLYRDYDVQQSCVGGLKSDGSDGVNELSYMMLDATEALGFIRCLSVRYSPRTDRAFIKRALEVVGHVQKGVPFFFNDDVMVPALEYKSVAHQDALNYTQIGCVETVIPGKSNPHAVTGEVNLLKALEYALNRGQSMKNPGWQCGLDTGSAALFDSFEQLEDAVKKQLDFLLDVACSQVVRDCVPASINDFKPVKSLLTQGCLESGKDFNNKGALYDYYQICLEGLPNLADSLAAVNKLIYQEKRYTMRRLITALKEDFPDEAMRQDFLNGAPKFGNDIDFVDALAAEIMDYCCDRLESMSEKYGLSFHAQPFTFLWMLDKGMFTAASPDGRHSGEPLAYSVSPMQGRDFNGFTALINSLCALPTKKAPGTTSAIVEVDPRLFTDANLENFVSIMLAAAQKGLCNVQFNVTDAQTLIDAQKHPEKYNNLAVRVSGFSQKFNLLEKSIQDHIIGRTKHERM